MIANANRIMQEIHLLCARQCKKDYVTMPKIANVERMSFVHQDLNATKESVKINAIKLNVDLEQHVMLEYVFVHQDIAEIQMI